MSQKPKFRFKSKHFLALLAGAYVIYLVAFGNTVASWLGLRPTTITMHEIQTSSSSTMQYWTTARMRSARDFDQLVGKPAELDQETINQAGGSKQEGQRPRDGSIDYPRSTVGKVFFTNGGRNYVCSGTALASSNHNTFDTAGHCLYWTGDWSTNVLFCPLYDHGDTPYGCWAARELAVPSDWLDAGPNDLHHDFGMAIVTPNDEGNLTEVVGGAGWAYNQSVTQTFYAYGYPAAYPFDGQSRQSCEGKGKGWNHAGGPVVSIPCNMTGGSSGGPWFIKSGGNWYLNGHNDFTSSIQPGHMFSPYYDDTWSALYQQTYNS